MDGSPPKTNRKVRFSLPEPTVPAVPSTTPVQKQRMAHGTVQYVNGTLISHQSQQTHPPAASHGGVSQSRAHQTLQVTPTPTSLSSTGPGGCSFKPKELNNKIVLHLRPSVSSLDSSGSDQGSSPKAGQSPGASIDGAKGPSANRQKSYSSQKPIHGTNGSTGSGGARSLKSLPQINQKFPSSEDVNNNVGGAPPIAGAGAANRQKSSDDLSSLGMWNHPVKKPTIILRTISASGTQQKSLTGRTSRAKGGLGKLPASGASFGVSRPSKTLISPHLQPMEGGGGVLIRVQENCTAVKCTNEGNGARIDEINVSSIIRGTNATNSTTPTTTTRPYGKSSQFLAVPEYSDRYEGMETVVSATLPDEEEEDDDLEDSEQDAGEESVSGRNGTRNGHASEENGGGGDSNATHNHHNNHVHEEDDTSFRCSRDTKLSRDKNTAQFWDFVERWRTNRALKKLESATYHHRSPSSSSDPHHNHQQHQQQAPHQQHQHRLEATGGSNASITPVSIGGSIKSDAKSEEGVPKAYTFDSFRTGTNEKGAPGLIDNRNACIEKASRKIVSFIYKPAEN
ncbi:hypothetical protein ZHAS_00019064 [Anopheles sinensis]|uniref:Uncharacterized protein n=1 Tax=Anopheles sinensis TaxID=74873 RepID=A0A084WLC3_ANOSI|nr:hypothetical protein ZHAS_00019064 [Anopheles sinensis]